MSDALDWLSFDEAVDIAQRMCFQYKVKASDIFTEDGKIKGYEVPTHVHEQ